MSHVLNIEALLRIGCFAGILTVMGVWELLTPRRRSAPGKRGRWTGNLGLVALNSVLVRLLVPAGLTGVALLAQAHGWGLFNQLHLPGWLAVLLAVIILDFAIYLQHVLFHAIPLLWRLHMVHHADVDFDVTTGIRFHTVEIVLSLGIKSVVIVLLGAAPLAVLLFEILLNGTSMFNHGNVRIPPRLDRILRLLVVTPDMHRVHHSVIRRETNSNFGFNLPWWDYLLGTYRDQPAQGHTGMTIGLSGLRDRRTRNLPALLLLPLRGDGGPYPLTTARPVPPRPGDGPAPRLPGDGPVPPRPGDGPAPRLPGDGPVPPRPGDGPAPRLPGDGPAPRLPGDGPAPRLPGDGEDPPRPDPTPGSTNAS